MPNSILFQSYKTCVSGKVCIPLIYYEIVLSLVDMRFHIYIYIITEHHVGNSLSVSQSLTLDKKDKVKHYIRIKIHNIIILKL